MNGMEIELTRGGKFHATTMKDTPTKCGAMRNRSYAYAVRIEARDVHLSPEGFLLNNELVQEYFDTRFGHKAPKWEAFSCENMARTAASELCDQLLKSGIVVICVEVSLTGSNGAVIKARKLVEAAASETPS